ncbi:pantoate--beta-alanine ligase [Persephonella sp.]
MLVEKISEMKSVTKRLRFEGRSIGFVPTMGFLHEGHVSLIRRSKQDNDITVVSIFVNPLQFGENEDFDRYPRDLNRDLEILREEKVDYLFYPSHKEMYPDGFSTTVEVKGITEKLCGAFRPGHFKGVTTVVLKLFNIIKPDRAYFGLKDFQQYKVIERMVRDLNLDVEIVGCPIVREKDGLAMSSRNRYLTDNERKGAVLLSQALFEAKKMFDLGINDVSKLKEEMKKIIQSNPEVREIQYIEIVDSETFEEKVKAEKGDLIALAVFVGDTRLIDNIQL